MMTDGAELYLGKDMFSKGTKDLTRKKNVLPCSANVSVNLVSYHSSLDFGRDILPSEEIAQLAVLF
jgi:hypothetical protein